MWIKSSFKEINEVTMIIFKKIQQPKVLCSLSDMILMLHAHFNEQRKNGFLYVISLEHF